MGRTLHINVANKIATYYSRDGEVVCGNSDYIVAFTLDEEWADAGNLTARFVWAGGLRDVPISADGTCAMPTLLGTTECRVGVYSAGMRTTTAAVIPCRLSILYGESTPPPPVWAGFHLDFNEASNEMGIRDAEGRLTHDESQMVTLPFARLDDDIARIDSELVAAGKRMDAIDADIESVTAFAGNFVIENINGLEIAYEENTNALTLRDKNGDDISTATLTGVNALKAKVDLLTAIIENTIITLTDVEDTYTTRVTAGGLPVVSNTPTTVHKIAGDTKASENLFDLTPTDSEITEAANNGITVTRQNNTFTFSGGLIADYSNIKYFDLPRHLYGKTITFSQSKYFNSYTDVGSIVWKIGKTVDGVYYQLGTTFTNALTVTFDDPNAIYKLYIQTGNWKGQSIDGEETISFMANIGDAALPYSDYYAGLKNASFKSVTSTGSNIVDIYGLVGDGITKSGVTITQEQDGYLHFSGIPTGSYRQLFTISQDLFQDGETYTFAQSDYFGKYGSAYKNKNAVYWKVSRKNLATGETNYSLISTDASTRSVTFDKKTYSYNIDIVTGSYAYTSGDEMDISLRFWINLGSTALTYEDYTTDTSFQLSAARQLRKWDYIDIDNQRVVTGTAEVTQDTAFTDEELATYPAGYILSDDRKTIAYPLETPTTAALTVPKSYTAWRNGSETVDTGATDALPPTITQTYYEEVTA